MNAPVASQIRLVAALESYFRATEGECRRIDTHMSHLFLTPSHVYKLKRAVRHPFADMSQLPQRETACREELAINRRMAPNLYKHVARVALRGDGKLEMDGDSPPVDYVVQMRRFADGALFSEMAAAGTLTPEHIDAAVDRLIELHWAQPPDFTCGAPDDLRIVLRNLRATALAGATCLPARMQRLFDELDRHLTCNETRLSTRRASGRVRRGHGDFHLQNICVFEGAVTPFDALEFDPTLATTDVIYDLAFLLMDLQARDRRSDANRAMNRYWDLFDEAEEDLALLPFFMALRAAVRMAVAREADKLDEADLYLTLAEKLLTQQTGRLVAVGGLSGSGKSSVARGVAPYLPGCAGARILSADVLRKRGAGLPLDARLDSAFYTPERRAQVYAALDARAGRDLRAGMSVVADATFQDSGARRRIEAAAEAYSFTGIWLEVDVGARTTRVAARQGDVSDISAALAAQQAVEGDISPWRRIDAGRALNDVVDDVLRLIGEPA